MLSKGEAGLVIFVLKLRVKSSEMVFFKNNGKQIQNYKCGSPGCAGGS